MRREARLNREPSVRPRIGELFQGDREAPEVAFEHCLSQELQDAVVGFIPNRSETYHDPQYEGSNLAAVAIVLPQRVGEVRRDYYARTSLTYAVTDLARSDSTIPQQHYELLLGHIIGAGDVAVDDPSPIFDRLQQMSQRKSPPQLQPSSAHKPEIPLLLSAKILAPQAELPPCDDARVYRTLAQRQFIYSFIEALYLRLVHPDRDVIADLSAAGFSMKKFESDVAARREKVEKNLHENVPELLASADVFILTQLLALQAVLTAERVEVGDNGRIVLGFTKLHEDARSLPERNAA